MIKAPPPSIYVHVDATWYVLFIIFLFSVSRQKLLEFDLPAGGDYCFCMDRCMYVCMYVFSFCVIPRQASVQHIWLLIGMHVNFVHLQLHGLGTD